MITKGINKSGDLQAAYAKYMLDFKEPGGTSRGVLTQKETWFIKIFDSADPAKYGVGECAVFRGLSADDRPDYELKLKEVCCNINQPDSLDLKDWSSIHFGVETALADLKNGGVRIVYPSPFVEGKGGIEINGLIWMGDQETMRQRIVRKLDAGFKCIKLKIGAIDFDAELALLKTIRDQFSPETVELRVDANGAFRFDEALKKMDALSKYSLHSIEQPIRRGQWEEMGRLCRATPIPIALDEELIGIHEPARKEEMLSLIQPQYIILKPALAGGFGGSSEWIALAEKRNIGWWITSALESNIGLNAIAQWTYLLHNPMPQGLGTGQLYTNNIFSPIVQREAVLTYDPNINWDLNQIEWKYV